MSLPTTTHNRIAVLVNPNACGGKARKRWQKFLLSDISLELNLPNAEIFENSGYGSDYKKSNLWFETTIESGFRQD